MSSEGGLGGGGKSLPLPSVIIIWMNFGKILTAAAVYSDSKNGRSSSSPL